MANGDLQSPTHLVVGAAQDTRAMAFQPLARLKRIPFWLSHGLGVSALVLVGTAFAAGGLCSTPWELLLLVLHLTSAIWTTAIKIILRGFRPLYPEWTLQFEIVRAVIRCCTELCGHKVVILKHTRYIRWQSSVLGTLGGSISNRYHNIVQSSVVHKGMEHLWLKPACSVCSEATCTSPCRLVVLYPHGGGSAFLTPRMYISFCNSLGAAIKNELSERFQLDHARVEVFVANYRKVPEYQFPIPAEDAVAMYRYLVQHESIPPQQIIVAGDSAGGSLALSVLLRLRSQSPELMPLAGILCCTLADLTPSYRDKHASPKPHCVLSTQILDAGRSVYHKSIHDPSMWEDASAVQCDLRGLPPVFIQAGGLDFLFDHSLKLAKKAKADGNEDWELDIHTNMPHVFAVFPAFILPYARVGIQRMAEFAARRVSCSMKTDRTVSKGA